MTEDEVLERLQAAVRKAGSLRAFATQHGFTASYIHDVLNHRRGVSDRIAEAVGVRVVRAIGFEPMEGEADE